MTDKLIFNFVKAMIYDEIPDDLTIDQSRYQAGQVRFVIRPAIREVAKYIEQLWQQRDELREQCSKSRHERDEIQRERDWLRSQLGLYCGDSIQPKQSPFLNPIGFYVYYLWNEKDECVYVGQSSNVCARIGTHIREKKDKFCRVTTVRCANEHHMMSLENQEIDRLQPELNIFGRGSSDSRT